MPAHPLPAPWILGLRLNTTIPRLSCSYDSGYSIGSASKMHLYEIWKVENR